MLFPYTWFLTFFPLSETVKQWDLVELIDFLWYLWLVALWHMFTFTYVTMWAVGNLGTGNLGLSFACHLPFNSSSGRCQTWGIPAFQVFDMICFELTLLIKSDSSYYHVMSMFSVPARRKLSQFLRWITNHESWVTATENELLQFYVVGLTAMDELASVAGKSSAAYDMLSAAAAVVLRFGSLEQATNRICKLLG